MSVKDLYPLAEKAPDRVKTPTGKSLADITLNAVLAGDVTISDLAITSEALHLQAEIALAGGRHTLAENFHRAAELVAIPQDVIMETYEMLRPGRADLKTLEEGAASLGASPWQRFRDIVVPNAMPGILAGALTVVTLSIGEFNLTWMLHTPYLKTLPVGLADSYASMRLEVASAYTLVFFVLIVPLLMAMQWASARAQRIAQ